MNRMNRYVLFMLSVIIADAVSATDGHQLTGIGAVQQGTAGAGVAIAEDATWVLLNPAGLVRLQDRVDVSFELFAPDRSIEPHGPGLPNMGGRPLANAAGKSSDDSMFYIPSLGAVHRRENDAFGIGLYCVNGMGVDYAFPRTTVPLATGQDYDRRTEYGVTKLAAGYAIDMGDGWLLGAQINGSLSRFRSDMLTSSFSETQGDFKWDNSFGGGCQLGIQKEIGPVSLGATYISRQYTTRFDRYDDLLPYSLDIPQMTQIGIAYRVLPSLRLLADYKYINWAGVEQLGNAPEKGGFGWVDQHVIKVGAIWDVTRKLTLRAGYSHGNSPIRSDVVFANSLFPAIVEDHLNAGFSYELSPRHFVHCAYMYAFRNTLADSGTGGTYSQAGKGTEISLQEQSFVLQLSYLF